MMYLTMNGLEKRDFPAVSVEEIGDPGVDEDSGALGLIPKRREGEP
jgi:hypothetical protein